MFISITLVLLIVVSSGAKTEKLLTTFSSFHCLPAFKKEWVEFAQLHSQALQATVKRVDLAYNSFFQGLRGSPKFKSIKVPDVESKFGSNSNLKYESIVAFDLGTATAITCYDEENFQEIENPRFTQVAEAKIKQQILALRRKRAPNTQQKIKASNRWKKAMPSVSKLQRKIANQRRDWQHKITSDIARRHDIGVTEQLNTKGMTRKAKKGSKRKCQKAGLNKSILSVGFGTSYHMIAYKIEAKGGLLLSKNSRQVKPSQRCPHCGIVHSEWAHLSNRYHVCSDCGFEIARDKGSVMVMYNLATNQQQGLGTSLSDCGCLSSTSSTSKGKHTGDREATRADEASKIPTSNSR